MIGICSVTGTCYAALAALSISAIVVPVRHFHVGSIVLAAIAICFCLRSFRFRVEESVRVYQLLHFSAQQERIRISERTKAGLARVRNNGGRLGRPKLIDLSKASRATIWRHKNAALRASHG